MRIVVTGAAGGIGRYVVADLLAHGHEVHALDRVAPPAELVEAHPHLVVAADVAGLDPLACRHPDRRRVHGGVQRAPSPVIPPQQLLDGATDGYIAELSQHLRPDPATRCLNRPCELSELMSRTIAP
jgi:nucleoside-diphosphate-sugar epimerase